MIKEIVFYLEAMLISPAQTALNDNKNVLKDNFTEITFNENTPLNEPKQKFEAI